MWARGSSGILAGIGAIVVAALAVSVYLANLPALGVSVILAGGWGFLLVFFRDPERRPAGPGVLSAADGRVLAVEQQGDRWRISVFMNVTDVHVNRFPAASYVVTVSDAGRGHRPAYRAGAFHNRQRSYALETALGPVEVVQMTGVFARRLVSFVAPGDRRSRGERLGMIILGSRVDVLLPARACRPAVRAGAVVRAGETVIATEAPA